MTRWSSLDKVAFARERERERANNCLDNFLN